MPLDRPQAPNYYQTPVEGTMFLALDLENWSEQEIRNENLSHLFDFNRAWARQMQEVDPDYLVGSRYINFRTLGVCVGGFSKKKIPEGKLVIAYAKDKISFFDYYASE